MTELKSSYPIDKVLKSAEESSAPAPSIPDCKKDTQDGFDSITPVVVSHTPRIDSRLILQNMEEVLHTVKQQHKEKHRRKKELKKLAMIKASANESASQPEGATQDLNEKPSHSDKKHKHREKEKRCGKKRPLQEKSTVENGKVLQESPLKCGSILHHFQRTPKKETKLEESATNENKVKVKSPAKNPKVTNAFEVMMNARNKTIGSNTPGKDSPSPVAAKESQELNAKRKLKLQEWAELKGGDKRKLEEEARAIYVEEQLEQRAKRFKKMLVDGASPKSTAKQQQPTKFKENTQKEGDKVKEKKIRSKTRIRRLSSIESIESTEITTPCVDAETEEFLSKLNSPTKKRDSLLGYFPKKESPKEMAVNLVPDATKTNDLGPVKVETPRRRGRKPATQALNDKSNLLLKIVSVENTQYEADVSTPSGRPRRSCATKARYDLDLEDSPTKDSKNAKGTPARKVVTSKEGTPASKINAGNDHIDIIVLLDDSTNMSTGSGNVTPQATPKKLAPLFVRSVPKPSPDPEFLKARKAFLQSGVPEKLRIEQEKQKQYDHNYEESIEIFPKLTHIRQLNEEEKAIDEQIVYCSLTLQSEETYLRTPSPARRKGKGKSNKHTPQIGALSDCTVGDFQLHRSPKSKFTVEHLLIPTLANKRAIVKRWKIEYDRFPTYKCYNQLREKYRYFSAIDSAQDTEQVTESFVFTRRTRRSMELQQKNKEQDNPDEEYKPPPTAPNGELLFSEKYKPLLFEQVLVNLNPVTQLKEFLSNWSGGGSGPNSVKNSQNFDDSMDFNESTSQGATCNTVVLMGPVSSGKTNSVFALANEMNFNVLEINAGMKRSGKKLIQELQEATQSHQIRKDAAGSGSSQKNNLLKKSLNGLKSKLKRQNSNSNNIESSGADSSNSELTQIDRKCLILIEDADIVFEQTDAGFTDAIYTLAASSKRPVIIVASNPNCSHLQRLIQQNTITFPPHNSINISRFLSVLSLIENCPIDLDDIVSLFLYNGRDLRRTLLELQFFIQSGGDRQKNKCGSQIVNTTYFASPRKRQFSTEQEQSQNQDNNLPLGGKCLADKSYEPVYTHRCLFEFYASSQNSRYRIPFPPDFHMFSVNLPDIFKVSRKLNAGFNTNTIENTSKSNKRKSKSPKKQWLTSMKSETPLDNLCSFYENLSIAALMSQEDFDKHRTACANRSTIMDRLNPNLAECISHTLLETAIEVNLDAAVHPYNVFESQKDIIKLCGDMGSLQIRSKRIRNLDYEPSLRSICRSEQTRSTLERRSTRFYHYLRTYTLNVSNFSSEHFDKACKVFQSSEETSEMAEQQPNPPIKTSVLM